MVWWFIILPASWIVPYVLIWKVTGSELFASLGGIAGVFWAVFGCLSWADGDD